MPSDDAPDDAPGRPPPGPPPAGPSPLDALIALGDLARRARAAPDPAGPDPGAPSLGAPPPEPPPEETGRGSRPRGGSGPKANPANYLGAGLYAFRGRPAKKLVAYVDPTVHRDVKAVAARRGTTMSELVAAVLRGAGFGGPDG